MPSLGVCVFVWPLRLLLLCVCAHARLTITVWVNVNDGYIIWLMLCNSFPQAYDFLLARTVPEPQPHNCSMSLRSSRSHRVWISKTMQHWSNKFCHCGQWPMAREKDILFSTQIGRRPKQRNNETCMWCLHLKTYRQSNGSNSLTRIHFSFHSVMLQPQAPCNGTLLIVCSLYLG